MKIFCYLLLTIFLHPKVTNASPQIIIGNDDLVTVEQDGSNIPAYLQSVFQSVGNMQNNCTVTHLGQGYAITAGHCVLPGQSENVYTIKRNKKWAKSACLGMEILFGPKFSRKHKSSCIEVIYAQWSLWADVALLKIDTPPTYQSKLTKKLVSRLNLKNPIEMLSYPQNRSLSYSGKCFVQDRHLKRRFLHDCDTLKGSSGGPVFQVKKDHSAEIVAVHNGGAGEMNHGTFIGALPKRLRDQIQNQQE